MQSDFVLHLRNLILISIAHSPRNLVPETTNKKFDQETDLFSRGFRHFPVERALISRIESINRVNNQPPQLAYLIEPGHSEPNFGCEFT